MTDKTTELGTNPVRGRIVVGVDGSVASKDALAWAARQAELTGSALEVIAAWGYPVFFGTAAPWPADFDPAAIATQEVKKTVEEVIGHDSSLVVRTYVREAPPATTLIEASEGADLLVVGCRGHGEVAGMLMGSVSQHCVTHSTCPVVVVHHHRPTT